MIGREETKSLLENTLSFSSADATEAVLWRKNAELTRFANNGIHQNVAEDNGYVIVRAVLGQRVGVAATNDLTETGLETVVDQALTAAKFTPENEAFPGLPEPQDVPEVDAFDEETADASPMDRAKPIRAICEKAKDEGCVSSGAFRTAVHEFGVANTLGLFAYHPATEADMTVVAMTDTSSGYAAHASWKVDDLDVVASGDRAIAAALCGCDPQPIDPGVYPVVLSPYATDDLLQMLTLAAGANFVQEGRSWMTGRRGERLMSPLVSIWDDGLDPDAWPFPFDFEGVPRQRVGIVRDGVVGDAVYDRARAAEEGKRSTGHALPATNPFNPWLNAARYGPVPLHPMMESGERSTEELIAEIDRGIYVSRFWYTRFVHPREAVVTGMTRDGTFLIEDGQIVGPVRGLRFTQSYVKALAEVEEVGGETCRVLGGLRMRRAPALRIGAFEFTGTTEF